MLLSNWSWPTYFQQRLRLLLQRQISVITVFRNCFAAFFRQLPVVVNHNIFFFRWERRVDERGRVYYVDHNTRTTTWLRPDTTLLAAHSQWQQSNHNRSQTDFNQRFLYPQQQQQMLENGSAENDSLGPLPEGWEKRVDKTSRVSSSYLSGYLCHY